MSLVGNKIHAVGISILLFIIPVGLTGQSFVHLSGQIVDTTGVNLAYANVIVDGQNVDDTQYVISDSMGRFRLKIQKGKIYKVTVTHLGYRPGILNITATKDTLVKVIMKIGKEKLNEVIVRYRPRILVKEDTTVFAVDSFRTGKERKLRQILNNLPGMEVDRDGKIRFHGKKVKKVLVENNDFFTGDPALAVNHIPASAVDEIQMLDNYQSLSYMKNYEDSDDLVMNVKLKKDKKKFYFGDMESGGGIKNVYLLNPSIFYYSPEKQWQVLGRLNNTGDKTFSLKNFMEFDGNMRINQQGSHSVAGKIDADLLKWFGKKDVYKEEKFFSAVNLYKVIHARHKVNFYALYAGDSNFGMDKTTRVYFDTQEDTLKRNNQTGNRRQLFFSKFIWKFHNRKNDIFFQNFFKIKQPEINSDTRIEGFNRSDQTLEIQKNFSREFKQNLEWFRKINFHDVLYSYISIDLGLPENKYLELNSQNPLFPGVFTRSLPDYLVQKTHSKYYSGEIAGKYYHVITPDFYLYLSGGYNYHKTNFNRITYPFFNESEYYNDLNINNLQLNRNQIYAGLEGKSSFGNAVFKPGMIVYFSKWTLIHSNTYNTQFETFWTPEMDLSLKISTIQKLRIKYKLNYAFPSDEKMMPGIEIKNLNRMVLGNSQLMPEIFHSVNASFSSIDLIKRKLTYTLFATYRDYIRSVSGADTIVNGNILTTYRAGNLKKRLWMFSFFGYKYWQHFRFNVKIAYTRSAYEKPLNSRIYSLHDDIWSTGGYLKYKSGEKFQIKLAADFMRLKNNLQSKWKIIDKYSLKTEYSFWTNFIFFSSVSFERYRGINENYSFPYGQLSLQYHKTDSGWWIEGQVKNLFDKRERVEYYISEIYQTERHYFVFPRMILLKAGYQF